MAAERNPPPLTDQIYTDEPDNENQSNNELFGVSQGIQLDVKSTANDVTNRTSEAENIYKEVSTTEQVDVSVSESAALRMSVTSTSDSTTSETSSEGEMFVSEGLKDLQPNLDSCSTSISDVKHESTTSDHINTKPLTSHSHSLQADVTSVLANSEQNFEQKFSDPLTNKSQTGGVQGRYISDDLSINSAVSKVSNEQISSKSIYTKSEPNGQSDINGKSAVKNSNDSSIADETQSENVKQKTDVNNKLITNFTDPSILNIEQNFVIHDELNTTDYLNPVRPITGQVLEHISLLEEENENKFGKLSLETDLKSNDNVKHNDSSRDSSTTSSLTSGSVINPLDVVVPVPFSKPAVRSPDSQTDSIGWDSTINDSNKSMTTSQGLDTNSPDTFSSDSNSDLFEERNKNGSDGASKHVVNKTSGGGVGEKSCDIKNHESGVTRENSSSLSDVDLHTDKSDTTSSGVKNQVKSGDKSEGVRGERSPRPSGGMFSGGGSPSGSEGGGARPKTGSPYQSPLFIATRRKPEFQDAEFVVDVRIDDMRKIGDGMNAYMTYRITTRTTMPNFHNKNPQVYRRFSDFLGLHEKLVAKHLHMGRIVPCPPEKSVIGMTKVKISKDDGGANVTAGDFLIKRRAALQRYLQRLANHPIIQTDPGLIDFLEQEGELPKASSTVALSSAGIKRLFSRVGDGIGKIVHHIDNDHWFDEREATVDQMDSELRKLLSSVESLVDQRKELSDDSSLLCKSLSLLGGSEEHSALSRVLSQLSDVVERVESVYNTQAHCDFLILEQFIKEYLSLLHACKVSFSERVKLHKQYKDCEVALNKKRELRTRSDQSGAVTRDSTQEINELEHRLEKSREDFDVMTRNLKEELIRFDWTWYKDLTTALLSYLQSLLDTQHKLIEHWERFIPQAKLI